MARAVVSPPMQDVIDRAVEVQYQDYPYPLRRPEDERSYLRATTLGELRRASGVLWGGRREMSTLRLLDAGCGTGDSAIYMAAQAPEASVVGLDRSPASLDVARRRAEVRGLRNVKFIEASLLDLPRLGLEPFDYIVCSGVLHHLPEPEAGLRALMSALAPHGGVGMMLYGLYGRLAIYPMQDLLRKLGGDLPLGERATLAREVVDSLWPHHFFTTLGHRSGADLTDGGPAGVIDLLLHPRDRAYTVDQIHELLADASARLVTFSRPLLYRADGYPMTDTMRRQMAALDERGRQGVCELLNGRLGKHELFATHAGFVPDVPSVDADPREVRPVVYDPLVRDDLSRLRIESQHFERSTEGCAVALTLSPMDAALLRGIDGERTLDGVFREARRLLVRAGIRPPDAEVAEAWARLFPPLEAIAHVGLCWARP
jgi:SAM-dependent methyltransferase